MFLVRNKNIEEQFVVLPSLHVHKAVKNHINAYFHQHKYFFSSNTWGTASAMLRLESLDKPEKPSPCTIHDSSFFEYEIGLVNGSTIESDN